MKHFAAESIPVSSLVAIYRVLANIHVVGPLWLEGAEFRIRCCRKSGLFTVVSSEGNVFF